jgi:hypothetical protein
MTPDGFKSDRRSCGTTDEWYTPPEVFDALGISFDLDPAAPPGGVPWIPADRHFSKADDGLRSPWAGRVWLNPPYGRQTASWLARLAEHGDGIALAFARTDTQWFHQQATRATAICFIAGRLKFVRGEGQGESSTALAPSLLIAYGLPCAIALAQSGLGQTFLVPNGGAVPYAQAPSSTKTPAGRLCRCVCAQTMDAESCCAYAKHSDKAV